MQYVDMTACSCRDGIATLARPAMRSPVAILARASQSTFPALVAHLGAGNSRRQPISWRVISVRRFEAPSSYLAYFVCVARGPHVVSR